LLNYNDRLSRFYMTYPSRDAMPSVVRQSMKRAVHEDLVPLAGLAILPTDIDSIATSLFCFPASVLPSAAGAKISQ